MTLHTCKIRIVVHGSEWFDRVIEASKRAKEADLSDLRQDVARLEGELKLLRGLLTLAVAVIAYLGVAR